jgi:hypothetical protein
LSNTISLPFLALDSCILNYQLNKFLYNNSLQK